MGSSKLKMAAKKFLFLPCSSFCSTDVHGGERPTFNVGPGQDEELYSPSKETGNYSLSEIKEADFVANISSKNVCTICLEPLLSSNATSSQSPGKAVFTSQCSHSFHLSCISSNIRHGSITCPICRAQWTRLPHTLHPPCWPSRHQDDPIIRILDNSISTFRVHRRSFLRTAQYNDDDPVEPPEAHASCHPRLCFNLILMDVPQTPSPSSFCSCVHNPSPSAYPPGADHLTGSLSPWYKHKRAAYLCVRLAPQQAIDLVLVASPNGPHLRLLKQAISLVVYSLRPIDRLAVVSYSSAAARIFPLRRMTSYGKRAALQVIDRLFYAGHADPAEGIRKGIKILQDRTHENPFSSILHLSDYPNSSRYNHTINDLEMSTGVSLHQFHVASTNSIMHELEEFLGQLLGGVVKELQLRIGDPDNGRLVRLGDLRGDEERRVLLKVDESHDHTCIGYSYVESGLRVDEHIRVGEVVVGISDATDTDDGRELTISGGRTSCVDSWDYHDPYMARRWAKRLHGRHRI
ncbi:probable E3 ubiquitin-protein ligase EDA40 isoform X2 [Amaranthus tricolor]|uniref:probable E3 ubiquitin-protein ligase EDA40 isoform X2 n=1 Tax=Amaranthus tricolor TaxID=29722 RepID=UPI00258B21F8|nr:probable E3 ubiquitin-protein ligase EDA40 isoform X2 [Amaranthus tricolor]